MESRRFQIVLGAIETQLAEHPDVGEAVVLVRKDEPGDNRLMTYVLASRDAIEATPPERAASLRTHLVTQLPLLLLVSLTTMGDVYGVRLIRGRMLTTG